MSVLYKNILILPIFLAISTLAQDEQMFETFDNEIPKKIKHAYDYLLYNRDGQIASSIDIMFYIFCIKAISDLKKPFK